MSDTNSINNPPGVPNEPAVNKIKRTGRKRIIIIGTVVVLFLVMGIAGLGIAKGHHGKHRGGHGQLGFILGKIAKDLNLNEQQKAEVEKIKNEIKAKKDAMRESRKTDADEMERMFRGDSFDKQKAIDLEKKRYQEREEMKTFMVDQLAKFHAILTTEQRNKAADKMKEFRERKHGNKKNWVR